VTRGEDETVAIEPFRGIRAIAQRFPEKHGTDLGGSERQTEVAGVAGVDGIDGETAGFVGGFGEQIGIHGEMDARPVGCRSAATLEIPHPLTSKQWGQSA
jgi:hypothetical protein